MTPVSYAPTTTAAVPSAPTGTPETVLAALAERTRGSGLSLDATLAPPTGVELSFAAAKDPGALWLTEHITAPAPGDTRFQ